MRNRTAIVRVRGCPQKGLETLKKMAQGKRQKNIEGGRSQVREEGGKIIGPEILNYLKVTPNMPT